MLAFALAHRARPHRTALAQGPGSGRKANPLLRLSRNLDQLRRLPRLARPPRSPRHLHHPAPPPLGPKNRMRTKPQGTFRIAVREAVSAFTARYNAEWLIEK